MWQAPPAGAPAQVPRSEVRLARETALLPAAVDHAKVLDLGSGGPTARFRGQLCLSKAPCKNAAFRMALLSWRFSVSCALLAVACLTPKGPAQPDVLSTASPNPESRHKEWSAEHVGSKCTFPPEAESLHVDIAIVVIVVDVRADGTPSSVAVVSDPGHGFGDAAMQCAMEQRYVAARDDSGRAVASRTKPFRIRFVRGAAAAR
jgi:Gram-negative bacterial TonB protein C-terminal